jgi:sialate O-acetylesterase
LRRCAIFYITPMNRMIIIILFLLGFQNLRAEIKLPALVGSNMVLQRDKPIHVWGYAGPNEKVTISFNDKNTETTATAEGQWTATLPKMKAGGPFTMTLKGKNTIVLNDILIGDVWLCSGQSNMEFALESGLNATQEIAEANYPNIRLFTVQKKIALKPEEDTKGSWTACTPQTARYFSAIGYFFGRKIQKDLNIPIGLINSSWGGTVIESWISPEGLANEPTFGKKAATVSTFDSAGYNSAHRKMDEEWVRNFNKHDQGFKDGAYLWANGPTNDWQSIQLPNGWEFSPQADLWSLDGIVWFSKEVMLTEADLNKNTVLSLGVIQNVDISFVNGEKVGQTPDVWGRKRKYTIRAGLLRKGKNIITVRVENYAGDGGFSITPDDFYLQTGDTKHSLAGAWKYKIGYKQTKGDRPEKELGPNTLPTLLYNNMVSPLINYGIKGVLWYQGESNWERAFQYRSLFPMMIADWRKKFNQGDFPFLFVQLANFNQKVENPGDSYWAELREAQSLALNTKNTGMTTAIDVGDAANIHPKNKQALGLRLANLAEQSVYHLPVKALHPAFQEYKKEGQAILLKIKNSDGLLKTANGKAPGNFQIAGADRKFYWASAEITGANTIKVSSPKVPQPVSVRYAWEDNPADANVVNKENLPMLPFRTDSWKGFTDDNK